MLTTAWYTATRELKEMVMQSSSRAAQRSTLSNRPAWARVGLGILAAFAGALAMFLTLGAIVAVVLYYGNVLGTVDLKDGPFTSALLVAFFVSPFVGAMAGVWALRRSGRRRSRREGARGQRPYLPG